MMVGREPESGVIGEDSRGERHKFFDYTELQGHDCLEMCKTISIIQWTTIGDRRGCTQEAPV
jgi:hypothetical protein